MKKILVAEDNDSNFLLMTYVLKKHYEYVRAHNGLEAVTMADDEGIDLILMDLRMPIKDGLQASSEIKAKRPDLPIIALTAKMWNACVSVGSDKEDALAAGCDDFIAKPVSHDICLKMIRKYIGE